MTIGTMTLRQHNRLTHLQHCTSSLGSLASHYGIAVNTHLHLVPSNTLLRCDAFVKHLIECMSSKAIDHDISSRRHE